MSDSNEEEFWLFGYGSLIWKPPPHFDLRIPGYITGYVRRFWQASEDHRGTPHSPGRVVTLIEHSIWSTFRDIEPQPQPHQTHHQHNDNQTKTDPPLPPPPQVQVHGIAYHIPAPHVPAVKTYLDMREINGYSIQHTTFYPSRPQASPSLQSFPRSSSSSPPVSPHHQNRALQTPQPHPHPIPHCTIYIGLPTNPQFHPQPAHSIAETISRSHGPSGANAEYLFMLEAGLRELSGTGGEGCVDEHVRDLAARVRVLMGGDGDGEGKDNDEGKVQVQAVGKEVQRVRRGDGGQASEETEKGITGLEID